MAAPEVISARPVWATVLAQATCQVTPVRVGPYPCGGVPHDPKIHSNDFQEGTEPWATPRCWKEGAPWRLPSAGADGRAREA